MKTLKQKIEESKFDSVYAPILEQAKKIIRPKKLRTDYKVFRFDEYKTTEEITSEMKKEGYEPVNPFELLEWEKTNKENGFFVALSSVFTDEYSYPCFLYVDRIGGYRRLGLTVVRRKWNATGACLAVKSLETKSPETSSDTLSLESRIESLEQDMEKIKKFLII